MSSIEHYLSDETRERFEDEAPWGIDRVSLSDLLHWLEEQGYYVDLETEEVKDGKKVYGCNLWGVDKKGGFEPIFEPIFLESPFRGFSFEEAVAQAVLWALKEKEKDGVSISI